MTQLDVDEALARVGGYRPWHLTIFVCLGFSMFMPLCHQGLNIVFIGYEPPHHCRVPVNYTFDQSIPLVENGGVNMMPSKCRIYDEPSLSNHTVPCQNGWTYQDEGYETIITEWDLVCENNYLSEFSQGIFHMVALVAELVTSFLCDRFGRRPVHVASQLLIVAFGTGVAFSVNYVMFIIMRSLTGFFVIAATTSGTVLVLELFDSRRRTFAGIALEFPWVVAYLLMPLLAWQITRWRYLQLAFSLLSTVWVIYIWILPESVPWLVATGKHDKAEEILRKMAVWNRHPTAEKIQLKRDSPAIPNNNSKEATDDEVAQNRDVTLHDALVLFRDPKLRAHVLIGASLWFANCVVYYCLILVSPSLAGNRFINFLIMGLVEIPAYIGTFFIVSRYGRRIPTCLFHMLAGIPLLVVLTLPKHTAGAVDLSPLSTTLVMVSKFGISGSFAIIVLYTRELFPTPIRATSAGLMNVAGRIGNTVAPMAAYASKTSVPWLPGVIMAACSVVVGGVALLLPETNGKPLPQTVADVHRLYQPAAAAAAPPLDDPASGGSARGWRAGGPRDTACELKAASGPNVDTHI